MSEGVYINMEMPKDCDALLHIHPDGRAVLYPFNGTDEPHEFTAVPVPAHGRLIDASEKIRVQMYDDMTEDYHIAEMTIDDLLSQGWVEADVPTIIPAEEGET